MAKVKPIFNPFEGKWTVYKEQNNTENFVVDDRTCLASANVGDLVMESETLVNRVDVVVDNSDIRPVFGIIIEKTSDTECVVLMVGVVGGFSGLTKSRKIFLSTTGSITSTPPTTDYMQSLGVAKEDSVIDFFPNVQRVRRT